jgi:hypothetical protein
MRTLRAAFVVTLSAACTRNAPPPVEPSHNPPALPEPTANPPPMNVPPSANPPAMVCPPRASLHQGDRCTTDGLECYLPTGGCQPSGFRCATGAWQEVTVTCNPPLPPPPAR